MKLEARQLRRSIFIDTSAFFALADRTDRFHSLAIQFVKSNEKLLVTSNLVVFETLTLLRMRLGHEPARKFGRRLFDETVTPLIRITPEDERNAWGIFRQYQDKRLSFIDCTSFVLIERLSIPEVFAFDDDFRQMGKWVIQPKISVEPNLY